MCVLIVNFIHKHFIFFYAYIYIDIYAIHIYECVGEREKFRSKMDQIINLF